MESILRQFMPGQLLLESANQEAWRDEPLVTAHDFSSIRERLIDLLAFVVQRIHDGVEAQEEACALGESFVSGAGVSYRDLGAREPAPAVPEEAHRARRLRPVRRAGLTF